MAQKRTRKRINEAAKPVAGSKKGPVSAQKQKELDQAEKADNQKTGSTAKSGPMKKESVDKFQQMLEYLVNEDTARAEDLFHEIVVEKSRQIYENLLQEEQDEEVEEADDEEVDESDDDELDESDDEEVDESDDDELDESYDEEVDEADDEEVDENFNLDEFEVEGEPEMDMDMGMMGGDASDDMEMDMDDEEGDMDMDADMDGDEPVTQDDIKDLEAELADLKAEFEQMLAGEEGDMDMGDEEGDMDMGDEEGDMDMGDEEGDMDMGDEEEEMPEENFNYESRKNLSQAELMREYVNKVGGEQYHQYGKMGDNGTNTKSPVAGKNDMGGTTANILKGGTESGVEANKGNLHGNPVSDQNPKDMSTGNVNVPGNKKAPAMKANSTGHGAERKGKPESSDKGAGSPLNGAPKRAK
jgi:hypothetical protein